MHEDIKRILDDSLPEHITLTEKQKSKIFNRANQRFTQNKRSIPIKFKPLLSGIAIILIAGMLSVPSFENWIEQGAYQQTKTKPVIEVTIPEVEYPSLINAIYVEETNEMIYTDQQSIYSYSLSENTKNVLVEHKENAQIFDIAVNEKWLIWEEISTSTLKILNRLNHSLKEVPNIHTSDLQLVDDKLIFLSFGNDDQFAGYKLMDLISMDESIIHQQTGDGAGSKASFRENFIVIPESFKSGDQSTIHFYLYDMKKQVKVDEFMAPYENANNVIFSKNKIWALLYNDNEDSILAYFDLGDKRMQKLNVPKFEDYAVYGDYLALSVPKKDSNTVKLYKITGDKVVALKTFDHINERLVKPRFTENGILIVNGEGKLLTMYLKDVNQLNH
ncbi:hypothetical protein [Pseudoneobacillus rhizosphaerae]|uniref:Uncharacterized protein n=1 Tax=Pseudoneobacillus rhizosphaerae TaxID=2880968 RepID=A0A9C7LCK9_9BACI|nr:hypothetical protein [Pseudoneobacillus rhizosphaerae]CAG9610727.1 hypothetical protein NEOCIP111885_04503 [Pseudoneobacillus rhizosphaerae]